jgi:P-type conjugative transfer protein TrbJ
MKIQFIGPAGQRGIQFSVLALLLVGTVMVTEKPAMAQFGGSCGCPVIVSDPEMYRRQGAQLAQETRMADLAAQNTAGGDSGTWQSQLGLLSGLGNTMTHSGGLCYTAPNAVQQFRVDFPGAVPPPVNAAQHMQQLASITLGTLGGALGVAQQQAAHFQYEDQEFAALEAKNAGVTGRLQAIQVSNEILLVQAQQLQLLRQLLITLINAETVYNGARLSTDVQGTVQASQFLGAGGSAQ